MRLNTNDSMADYMANSIQSNGEQENTKPAITQMPLPTGELPKPEKQGKHTRARYWTSFEEMRLIELWRFHFKDIDTYERNTPIYRTISEGMRERHVHLNAQECRRHMTSMRNKYLNENKRLIAAGSNGKSDWRLYPLVHCIFAPRKLVNNVADTEIMNETQLLEHINKTLSTLRQNDTQQNRDEPHPRHQRIRYDYDPFGCPFLENTQEHTISACEMPCNKINSSNSIDSMRLPLQSRNHTQGTSFMRHCRRTRLLPGRGFITQTQIELLRTENQYLMTKRDDALRQLAAKEAELKQLQCLLHRMQMQNERLLQIYT